MRRERITAAQPCLLILLLSVQPVGMSVRSAWCNQLAAGGLCSWVKGLPLHLHTSRSGLCGNGESKLSFCKRALNMSVVQKASLSIASTHSKFALTLQSLCKIALCWKCYTSLHCMQFESMAENGRQQKSSSNFLK